VLGVLAAPAWSLEAGNDAQAEIQKLIDQLGDPSYKVRKEAEQALRAKRDAARAALEKTAASHADPEVRWRAQRLLEERGGGERGLRRRDSEPRAEGRPTPGFGPGLQDEFDEMFRRLEREFGIDVPRQRFFGNEFFRDLEQQMRDLREQMRKGAFSEQGHSQSVQIQTGPDGVRVKVSERNEAGEVEEQTYEADDMEAFREKYPEIAKRYLEGGDGFRVRVLPPPGRMRPLPPAVEEDGPKLGVYVREVAPDVAEFLRLADGQGLVVQEVIAGGLAQSLGIEAGDIVLEVDGKAVFGIGDVAAALRAAGEQVTVKVNRRGKELALEGKPEHGKKPLIR
jgi:hypothetical protein